MMSVQIATRSDVSFGSAAPSYVERNAAYWRRNLAIGVLVRMALDPLSSWLGHTAHELGKEHGSISISFGVSDSGLLMVIFTGAVIAITAALAHAAKIAEENASFV